MPEHPRETSRPRASGIACAEEIRKNRHIIAAASADLCALRLTAEQRVAAGGALSSDQLQAAQAAVRLIAQRPDVGQAAGVALPALVQVLDTDVALVQLQAVAAAAARGAEDGVILLDAALTERCDAVLEHVERTTRDEGTPAEVRRSLRTAFTAADLIYDTAQSESRARRALRASRRSAHERRLEEARRETERMIEGDVERLARAEGRKHGGRT